MARNITVYFADGTSHVYQNVPDEVTPDQVTARAKQQFGDKPIRHIDRSLPLGGAAPEEQSVLRQVADVPINIGTGIAQGIRFITDAFGADNPVSQNIRGVENYLQDLLSAQAKEDKAEISRIMSEAEDAGVGEQVVAGLKAFATAPLDTLSQAAGTALPTIIGGLAGGALRGTAGVAGAIASRAAMPAIGAVTGAGVAKSSIYDATKQAMLEAGANEATAEETASQAQEYGGKNLDQILIASGIGAFAAGTGLEKVVAGRIIKTAAAREAAEQGALRQVLGGAAKEAIPEAIQAGQEQLASNIALQREGFDVPTLRGVVGAATMEGIAGAALGGGAGIGRPRTEAEVAPEQPPEEPEITAEDLAPKGVPTRAAPIQAGSLEELRAQLPAAAAVAPPRAPTEEVAPPVEAVTPPAEAELPTAPEAITPPVEEAAPPAEAEPPSIPASITPPVTAEVDPLLPNAISVVQGFNRVGISTLQKGLEIDYPRAKALMVTLENQGFVSPPAADGLRRVYQAPAPIPQERVTPSEPLARGPARGPEEPDVGAIGAGPAVSVPRGGPAEPGAARPSGPTVGDVVPTPSAAPRGEAAQQPALTLPPVGAGPIPRERDAVGDPLPQEAAVIERGLRGKNIHEAAKFIADTAPHQAQRVIAQRVAEQLKRYERDGATRYDFKIVDKPSEIPEFLRKSQPLKGARGVQTSYVRPLVGPERRIGVYVRSSKNVGLSGASYTTVLHELIHATTASAIKAGGSKLAANTELGRTVRDLDRLTNTIKQEARKLKAKREAGQKLTRFETKLLNKNVNAIQNSDEVVAWGLSDPDMQAWLDSIPYGRGKTLWTKFVETIREMLGLPASADSALSEILRVSDKLLDADVKEVSKIRTADIRAGLTPQTRAVLYTVDTPAKKAPPAAAAAKSVLDVRRGASEKLAKPGTVKQVIEKLSSPTVKFETLAKNFQNAARPIKKLQSDLREAGKLEYIGKDKNNIEDQNSLAANRGAYVTSTEVEPVHNRLRKSIEAYANALKVTAKDALDRIDAYLIALHEPERRETKYLRNVPLDNTKKMEFLPNRPAMTAADARAELETLRSQSKNAQESAAILEMMRYLAKNHADARGYSPVKAKLDMAGRKVPDEMTTDFYDPIYNVIGPEYSQEALEATRAEYEALPRELKDLIDQVRADLNEVNALNKSLNRRANYWTDKVDRVIESYGWKNYVPFKGNPRADKSFDTDTEFLSGELTQVAESFEGRRTNFDSPILQAMAESYFAASRAGRGTDLTTTIKNLIKLGVIKSKTKKPKIFTFEERNSPDFDYDQVRGRDKVLHYNEDGSVEVFSIENPEILEAIKSSFREMNWAVKVGNTITSSLGQMHTRFNPAFAPMDFIRNSITNAGLISAREGGKMAREYLAAVATNVARNGFAKAGKLSRLVTTNNTAELDRLYKKGHPFYRDAIDMMKYGGRTMYRMSFNITDTATELEQQLGPNKIIKSRGKQALDIVKKWFDAYNDAFELTSRVAAYSIRKQQNIAEAKKKGINTNDRKVMEDIEKEAAAFALSLMDFRKIGKYGRELGAYFMFIRPAATGAVDAIDALRPGFTTPQKAFSRLEPEVQELFETKTLAEAVKRIEASENPDQEKIKLLQEEIAKREKAFADFEKRQLTRAKNARNTAMFTVAAGAAIYAMAAAVSGEDDEGRNRITSDDMSRWTRYARLPIIGGEGFLQIPWGFGVSGLMSAGAQTAALASGNSNFKDFAGNMTEIAIDSYLPIPASRINPFENFGAWLIDSAAPSAARPLVEFVLNVDAMGNPIYNSRGGKYADAFSGSSRPSELHREITALIFDMTNGSVSVSPDSVAFFLNNYADAPNHIAENSWNLMLTATGDKDFDAKKDTFVLRSFIGRNSNFDAREFAKAEEKIKALAKRVKTLEDLGTAEQLDRFYENNPNADILIDTYNAGVNGRLRKLREERNEVMFDRSLTPKERKEILDDIRLEENYIKKGLVEDLKAYEES